VEHALRSDLPALDAPAPAAPARHWSAAYRGLDSGFDAPAADRREVDRVAGVGAATYGELLPAAVDRILRWVRPGPADVLVDLGSGTGRFLVQAVTQTPVGRAVGVELSAHRHAVATRAWRQLQSLDSGAARRLHLVHADLRGFDWSAAGLVWFGSTCFSREFLGAVTRAARRASRLRRLLTTRPLPLHSLGGLSEVGVFEVPTTWTERVDVHVYTRRDGAAS
jgi:hypothetical protein